jgi:predicted O-methyltransferase YrrM
MSSLWFARRIPTGRLVSVESSPEWHGKIRAEFEKRGHAHVDYRLRAPDAYASAVDDLPDGSFDLVLVDGILRDHCMPVALKKVKPGGYVLFDNSDAEDDEHRRAEKLLMDGAAGRSNWVRHKTDFYPGMVMVCESLLVRMDR